MFDKIFNEGGIVNNKQIGPGDENFSEAWVTILSSETTVEEREFLALTEYETEENGSKPLGFYGQLQFLCEKKADKSPTYIAVRSPEIG